MMSEHEILQKATEEESEKQDEANCHDKVIFDSNDEEVNISELGRELKGKVVISEKEAYDLYCDYAHSFGFSDSRMDSRLMLSVIINLKQKRDAEPWFKFNIDGNGNWKVKFLSEEHNHQLARHWERHFLRSARNVSKDKGEVIEQMSSLPQNTLERTITIVAKKAGIGFLCRQFKTAKSEINFSRNMMSEHEILEKATEEESDKQDEVNCHDKVIFDSNDEEVNVSELGRELKGKVVISEKEAYDLYCDYAHSFGFSVRRGKQAYYRGTKILCWKHYYCAKQGFKNGQPSDVVSYHKPETRTGCEAMVQFNIDGNGNWKVKFLSEEHNHQLARHWERHILRSARNVSKDKGEVIEQMVNSGIRPIDAYSFMSKVAGGAQTLGFLQKDCYNHLSMKRMSVIENGDATTLVNHFRKRSISEGLFYWDVELDEADRMCNFYWRDARSKEDYNCFGDVIVFDTTYRTNKYDLICAPFIGINHHMQNVVFGCAFTQDETTKTFIWLFETFLKSMDMKHPKTIFTDGDQAMAKAIKEVFPDTRHRLCLWHISKNAPSHLGNLKSDRVFYGLWNKCIMVTLHPEIREHKWLNLMFKIRHKWSVGFNRDTFGAGVRSSQRSESTNRVLNVFADCTTNLTNFNLAFEDMVERWRQNEAEEDFHCCQTEPTRLIKNSQILIQAARHTKGIYKFQEEYLDGIGATTCTNIICEGSLYKFEITLQSVGMKLHTVLFNTDSMEISCSCKRFETTGWLCSHSMKALTMKNMTMIPDKYIMKRWTKDARKISHFHHFPVHPKADFEPWTLYCNRAMRYAYNLVMKSKSNDQAREIVMCGLDKIEADLLDLVNGAKSTREPLKKITSLDDKENQEISILDPIRVKCKGGSKKRLKGHFEKSKRKRSQQMEITNHIIFNYQPSSLTKFAKSVVQLKAAEEGLRLELVKHQICEKPDLKFEKKG
uniref:SWIM-type domain-containing protein n=1 Tax=Kalanchoe fedtschenkoi TaxID=63787 RepID=A0A7N0UYE5_KALFE